MDLGCGWATCVQRLATTPGNPIGKSVCCMGGRRPKCLYFQILFCSQGAPSHGRQAYSDGVRGVQLEKGELRGLCPPDFQLPWSFSSLTAVVVLKQNSWRFECQSRTQRALFRRPSLQLTTLAVTRHGPLDSSLGFGGVEQPPVPAVPALWSEPGLELRSCCASTPAACGGLTFRMSPSAPFHV